MKERLDGAPNQSNKDSTRLYCRIMATARYSDAMCHLVAVPTVWARYRTRHEAMIRSTLLPFCLSGRGRGREKMFFWGVQLLCWRDPHLTSCSASTDTFTSLPRCLCVFAWLSTIVLASLVQPIKSHQLLIVPGGSVDRLQANNIEDSWTLVLEQVWWEAFRFFPSDGFRSRGRSKHGWWTWKNRYDSFGWRRQRLLLVHVRCAIVRS